MTGPDRTLLNGVPVVAIEHELICRLGLGVLAAIATFRCCAALRRFGSGADID